MRPSLRFLALALVGWGGIRAATLGTIPGAELFRVLPSQAKVQPLVATQFPALEPLAAEPATEAAFLPPDASSAAASAEPPRFSPVPVFASAAPPVPVESLGGMLPNPRRQFANYGPDYPDWPMSRLASMSHSPLQTPVAVPVPVQSTPADALKADRIDRLQLSAWAMMRPPKPGLAGSRSLAAVGSLGASQAGARLTYNFTRQIAVSVRSSSDIGRRGGEVAGGLRFQPVGGIPVWLNAERRQRIGRFGGGRSAFALFVEAGVYDRPMPFHFLLDSYVQAGIVGVRSRNRFVDGAAILTRPVYKQFYAGVGVWGGAQPGLSRLDVGPRVSWRVRNNVRVHADWRQKVAGNAVPGSGPAVTLSGNF